MATSAFSCSFSRIPFSLLLGFLCMPPLLIAADQDAALMKTSTDSNKLSNSEKKLYEQSIRSTKTSIARETLDVFYREAVDYYHDKRYDEAMELLDKIYSIDPNYGDVRELRQAILKDKAYTTKESTRESVRALMQKGDEALKRGQSISAIAAWKDALAIDPTYEPAKRKIDATNHAMAQKEFETGYLHYHHGDLEDALDSWSNAIALDPSFKERGLLVLMSKVERKVRQDQIGRLAAQGYEQYQAQQLPSSLQSYEELLKLDPRHEEARRMSGKIRIQLGRVAFQTAQDQAARKRYADAIQSWQSAIGYKYEVTKSQKGIQDAESAIRRSKERPKVVKRKVPETHPAETVSSTTTTAAPAEPAAPPQPANPAEALAHYRTGLTAIRGKDYRRAIEELEIAAQLDPTNERIYMAKERAKQEWAAQSNAPATPQ